MAVLEKSTAYKQPGQGGFIRNASKVGLNSALAPLEAITGKNFYNPDVAEGWGGAMKFTDKLGAVANVGGKAVLNMFTGGMAGKVIEGVGGMAGGMIGDNAEDVDPSISAMGAGAGGALAGLKGMEGLGSSGSFMSKYGGKIYGKKGKRYFALGGSTEIPPNAYMINKSMQPKIINGEKTGTFIQHSDSLPFQSYGEWEVLPDGSIGGVNVPPPLPRDAKGNVDFNAVKKLGIKPSYNPPKKYGGAISKSIENPMNQWKDGGSLLTEYNGNTHELGGIAISDTDEVEDKENSFNLKDGNKYIFSNSVFMDNGKKTFAQGAKRIASKYKLREGDAMAKTAQERELTQLSEKQEVVKSVMNPQQGVYDEGGYLNTMFANGGFFNPATQQFLNGVANKKGYGTYGTNPPGEEVNDVIAKPMTEKLTDPISKGYDPKYGIPMAGYGVQALSNLPALFAKPNKVKFDRIRPETIDLSAQRDEARRSRNLQLAMAQRQAGMTGDAGQAGAYANAASSNITGNYGDAFNQSVMQQNNTNVGIRNQAQAQNAETQMREALVNQQELNSIREGKQQAVSNMGTIAAQAGKTYGQMNQEAGMMDWLNISNPDYGIKNEQYESALKQWLLGNKSITPYRKKSVYGGKIRRTK